MHGLQWDYSFPRSPHGEELDNVSVKKQEENLLANVDVYIKPDI
jgi:hypothetical protein